MKTATGGTKSLKEVVELAAMVDPNLLSEIKKVGAFDISACFNCGNCTAICPLSKAGEEFPRKMIRYATVGLEDKLLSSAELWSCDYCGKCTKTCPRDADPGAFMMAARRYAIQKYSWGKISNAMYNSRTAFYGTLVALSLSLASIIFIFHGQISLGNVDLFSFIPMDTVDRAGMIMGAFVGMSALANLMIMKKYLSKYTEGPSSPINIKMAYSKLAALGKVIVDQVAIQKSFHTCTDHSRYWAHILIVWGFAGLLVATTLDYMIDAYGVALSMDLPRGLGIISGVALVCGSAYFIYKRFEGKEDYATFTHFTDWTFLLLLLSVGFTGFLLDLFVLFDNPILAYATYSLHLIVVFDLLITAPFTKFAHAIYRPLALWTQELGRAAITTAVSQEPIAVVA
jgi:heterodisulfide reductase subunit C